MFSDEPLPGAHSNTADTETHAPPPPTPRPEAAFIAAPPRPGLSGWPPSQTLRGSSTRTPPSHQPPLDPHPGQPWDPPQVTAVPLPESRAPPLSRAAQTQACSRRGGCRARQDWTGPGCPRTSPSPASSSRKPPAPWLALGLLCAQDPTGHGAQNNMQTRQLGWGRHKKPKTALAQPASPGLGLWDPLGPGTGGSPEGWAPTWPDRDPTQRRTFPNTESAGPAASEAWGGRAPAEPTSVSAAQGAERSGRPARAPRLSAPRQLRGARRPRQHKQASGASLPAAASAPSPGGGACKHPGPQALLPLGWKTLPPGEGSPWKRPPRGLQQFPRPSEANPSSGPSHHPGAWQPPAPPGH